MKVIKDVALNNKSFLTGKHTAKRCRKDPWFPSIALRGKLKLNDTPENLMLESINKQINKLLDEYEKPEISFEIQSSLREYMLKAGVDKNVLDVIDL